MKTSFLFLDESNSPQTNISSLTGVVIPIDQYAEIRDQFYTKLIEILNKDKDFINLKLSELHASKLLNDFPGATDEIRFQVFNLAADLVIEVIEPFQ